MIVIKRNKIDYLFARLGMGDTAEIFDLAVYSDRRMGVGSEMVNEAIKQLTKLNVKRVYAITRVENENAQRFYESLGFEATELPRFYPDGDAVMYIKEI